MSIVQVVQVEFLGSRYPYTYAYYWDPAEGDTPLTVGDKVEVPSNIVQEQGGSGTVVALGSDYKGEMKRIVRRIDGDADAEGDDMWAGFGEGDYA